jgi:hypothetical protein
LSDRDEPALYGSLLIKLFTWYSNSWVKRFNTVVWSRLKMLALTYPNGLQKLRQPSSSDSISRPSPFGPEIVFNPCDDFFRLKAGLGFHVKHKLPLSLGVNILEK